MLLATLLTSPAHACSPIPCRGPDTVPEGAEIPANAVALPFTRGKEPSVVQGGRTRGTAGHDEVVLANLKPGPATLRWTTCDKVQERPVTITAPADPPSAAGTVLLSPARRESVPEAAAASCSRLIPALAIHASLDFDASVDPWAAVAVVTWLVDGDSWSHEPTLTGSDRTAKTTLYTSCAERPSGLEPGEHEVVGVVRVGDTVVQTPPAKFELQDCRSGAEQAQAEPEPIEVEGEDADEAGSSWSCTTSDAWVPGTGLRALGRR